MEKKIIPFIQIPIPASLAVVWHHFCSSEHVTLALWFLWPGTLFGCTNDAGMEDVSRENLKKAKDLAAHTKCLCPCSQCQKSPQPKQSFKLSPQNRGEFQNALQTLLQLRGEFWNSPLHSKLCSNSGESFETLPCFRGEFPTCVKMCHNSFLSNKLSPKTLPYFQGELCTLP